jgi:hypothetical protein
MYYCPQHERFSAPHHRSWISFAPEKIARIQAVYELTGLPDLKVVEAACDHCPEHTSSGCTSRILVRQPLPSSRKW